jgi:hypothetical protein
MSALSHFDMSTRPRAPTVCIFCGSPDLTAEHVFSKWTHKFMTPRSKGRAIAYRGMQFPTRSDTSQYRLPGQVRDWKIKCVCGACNNGWMRRLENACKPIMMPLILGQPSRLNPDQQAMIATWAVLKAIISEYGESVRAIPHHSQRKYLKNRIRPPINWAVWIGSYARQNWKAEWVSRPFLLLPTVLAKRRSSPHATHFNSHVTTQVIGKLFIHVAHTPMPTFIERWRFAPPQGGALFRIWPRPAFSIKWPARALTDNDAAYTSNAITEFILDIQRENGLT